MLQVSHNKDGKRSNVYEIKVLLFRVPWSLPFLSWDERMVLMSIDHQLCWLPNKFHLWSLISKEINPCFNNTIGNPWLCWRDVNYRFCTIIEVKAQQQLIFLWERIKFINRKHCWKFLFFEENTVEHVCIRTRSWHELGTIILKNKSSLIYCFEKDAHKTFPLMVPTLSLISQFQLMLMQI